MKNGIVFDMDGVLFVSGPFHLESWRQLAKEENIPGVNEDWFRKTFGRASRELIFELLGGKVSPEEVARMDDRKETLYRQAVRGRVVAPAGLLPLIDRLSRAGWAIGVGSSGPRGNVDLIIGELGLEKRVTASVSAGEAKKGKPDPEIFLKAAERIGVPPERCVVVEDAMVGIEAARAAGMKCVAITTTHSRQELAAADRVIDSFEELAIENLEDLLNDVHSRSRVRT